jgi:predicted AlkP superfamily pyrophosphatase or phosphodiesterase
MKFKEYFLIPILLCAFVCLNWDCKKEKGVYKGFKEGYKTKNVIIVVIDGPRYSETWGLPSRVLIPNRAELLKEGVLCTKFYNNGHTFTNAGHAALTTGVYQYISNDGAEYPKHHSVFQSWLKQTKKNADQAWIITSKDKLAVLSDCIEPEWKGKFRPMTDCGNNGLGTGYRNDSITFYKAITILQIHHPGLTLINFKEPDASGHSKDSAGYVRGIIDTDHYIRQLWDFIQSDSLYKNKTTLIITNDHGRHTAGHLDGYVSHTDNCDGCRHIEFLALGPDLKKNYTFDKPYDQIDIANTIAELMGFKMPESKGKVIADIFK